MVINLASTCFKADKGIMDALVHLRKKTGRGEATVGESALAKPLWGMLYADDAGVLAITRAVEEDDGGDRGRVRGVWPHCIGGQD